MRWPFGQSGRTVGVGSGCFNGNRKFQLTTSNPRPELPLKNRSQTTLLFPLIKCVFYPSENERYAQALFDFALYIQTIIFPISPAARLKRSFPRFGFRLMLFSFFRFPKNPSGWAPRSRKDPIRLHKRDFQKSTFYPPLLWEWSRPGCGQYFIDLWEVQIFKPLEYHSF